MVGEKSLTLQSDFNIGLLLFLCILMQLHHGGSLLTLKWDGVFNEI